MPGIGESVCEPTEFQGEYFSALSFTSQPDAFNRSKRLTGAIRAIVSLRPTSHKVDPATRSAVTQVIAFYQGAMKQLEPVKLTTLRRSVSFSLSMRACAANPRLDSGGILRHGCPYSYLMQSQAVSQVDVAAFSSAKTIRFLPHR